jgi:hypothetical protein
MDVQRVLAELRKELDAIEGAVLILERLDRPANLRADLRLECSTRVRAVGANSFHSSPEPEEISYPSAAGGRAPGARRTASSRPFYGFKRWLWRRGRPGGRTGGVRPIVFPTQITSSISPGSDGYRQIPHFQVQILHLGERQFPLTPTV